MKQTKNGVKNILIQQPKALSILGMLESRFSSKLWPLVDQI